MSRFRLCHMLLSVVLTLVLVLAGARDAHAAGNVILKTPQAQEQNGEWEIRVQITLPEAPATPPTIYFTFSKKVEFERTIEHRGEPPVVHRMPVDPPLRIPPEPQVVDTFKDPVSHHPIKTTNWSVILKRAAGYVAGEYNLVVSTSDGVNLGSPMNVTLNGDNPEVDRSDISFGGKITDVHSGVDSGAPQVAQNDTTEQGPSGMSTDTPAGSAPPMIGDQAFQPTPEEVKDRPKGCGCTVVGDDSGRIALAGGSLGALFALAFAARRRRRG